MFILGALLALADMSIRAARGRRGGCWESKENVLTKSNDSLKDSYQKVDRISRRLKLEQNVIIERLCPWGQVHVKQCSYDRPILGIVHATRMERLVDSTLENQTGFRGWTDLDKYPKSRDPSSGINQQKMEYQPRTMVKIWTLLFHSTTS